MSSCVRLAAWMAAIRAAAITSPLGMRASAMARSVAGFIETSAVATARRAVTGLAETSTIRARPTASRCVSERLLVFRCGIALLDQDRAVRDNPRRIARQVIGRRGPQRADFDRDGRLAIGA